MTKISVNQLSSNLWFGIIVFKLCIIISIRLGEFQRVDKNVHFKEVLEIGEFFTKLNTTERLFVWSEHAPAFKGDSCYGEPRPERNTACRCILFLSCDCSD